MEVVFGPVDFEGLQLSYVGFRLRYLGSGFWDLGVYRVYGIRSVRREAGFRGEAPVPETLHQNLRQSPHEERCFASAR